MKCSRFSGTSMAMGKILAVGQDNLWHLPDSNLSSGSRKFQANHVGARPAFPSATYGTDSEDVTHRKPLQDVEEHVLWETQQREKPGPPSDPALPQETLGTLAVDHWRERQQAGSYNDVLSG